MSNNGYRALLRQRNYMISLVAGTVSRFGDSLDAIAFSWLVYQITGDAALIALVFSVNFLPTVLLQPLVAPVCERLRKTRVIALCNAARGLCVCAGALLFLSDALSVGLLIGMVLFNSTVEAVESPAGNALSQFLLPPELYTAGAALRGGHQPRGGARGPCVRGRADRADRLAGGAADRRGHLPVLRRVHAVHPL